MLNKFSFGEEVIWKRIDKHAHSFHEPQLIPATIWHRKDQGRKWVIRVKDVLGEVSVREVLVGTLQKVRKQE